MGLYHVYDEWQCQQLTFSASKFRACNCIFHIYVYVITFTHALKAVLVINIFSNVVWISETTSVVLLRAGLIPLTTRLEAGALTIQITGPQSALNWNIAISLVRSYHPIWSRNPSEILYGDGNAIRMKLGWIFHIMTDLMYILRKKKRYCIYGSCYCLHSRIVSWFIQYDKPLGLLFTKRVDVLPQYLVQTIQMYFLYFDCDFIEVCPLQFNCQYFNIFSDWKYGILN